MSKPSQKKSLKQKLRQARVQAELKDKRAKNELKKKEERDKYKAEAADRREQSKVNRSLITVDYKRNPLTPRLTREEAIQRFKDNTAYLEEALRELESNKSKEDLKPMFGGNTEFIVTPNPMPPSE